MAKTIGPLFRIGNKNAELDRIRNKDVSVYSTDSEAEICARAPSARNTAGISCWSDRHKAARYATRGRLWELPAQSDYDDTRLRLWEPHPGSGHWQWSPAYDMPGTEFIAALRFVKGKFK
jgi:hypothetical protein